MWVYWLVGKGQHSEDVSNTDNSANQWFPNDQKPSPQDGGRGRETVGLFLSWLQVSWESSAGLQSWPTPGLRRGRGGHTWPMRVCTGSLTGLIAQKFEIWISSLFLFLCGFTNSFYFTLSFGSVPPSDGTLPEPLLKEEYETMMGHY